MSRTTLTAERILPYAPADLCRLVGDVREYPKFVPFLQSLRVRNEKRLDDGGWIGVAEADVGWKAIHVRFSTGVRCEPSKGEVDVKLERGPLRALENRWRFAPHEHGAHVHYWIEYEFKNPLLQAAISANRDKLSGRIMTAFEQEARRRLARASN